MDFARRELEKYGWKEGKGLGKNEDGISNALKPTFKFDNSGVGHKIGKDFTNTWWQNVYNNAAKNIEVIKGEKRVKIKRIDNAEEVEISTKNYSLRDLKRKNDGIEYGSFLKAAKLTQEGVVSYKNVITQDEVTNVQAQQISDEDLFAICGKRTAHKGARHGLKLAGKLFRIEQQEKAMLEEMQKKQKQSGSTELSEYQARKKKRKSKAE